MLPDVYHYRSARQGRRIYRCVEDVHYFGIGTGSEFDPIPIRVDHIGRSGVAFVPFIAFGPLVAFSPFVAFRTLRAGRSFVTFFPLVTFWTCHSLLAGGPCWSGGAFFLAGQGE